MIQIIPFHFSSEQLDFTVDLKGGKNEKFPEFNEKIQVLKDNVAGRYIVTNEDIKPFETVLSEDAFAAILVLTMSFYPNFILILSRFLSISSHFGNFVFGCFWRQSYQNIT